MYKHCTTEESVQRQRQLEGCLLQLMQSLPYPQITVSHICNLAGISRKSFYRYFGSREDCLYALIDHCIIDGASVYLPEHTEHPQSFPLYLRFFRYWRDTAPLLDVLSRNNLHSCLTERLLHYAQQEERDFHYYLGGSADDSYEQVLFMVTGLVGVIFHWHSTNFQKTPAQMAELMESISHK